MLLNTFLFPLFFCVFLSEGYGLEARNINYEVKKVVENEVSIYNDRTSVYYYKLDGSEKYCLNEDMLFIAASLTKVPQAMEVIDKVYDGKLRLDDVIEYYEEDYEEGTGILKYKNKIEDITVGEAIELSIKYSDNIANNMLNRVCGYDINRYISDITGEEMKVGNLTTAREQAGIYYKLFSDDRYSQIVQYLKNTCCHERIDKYLEYRNVAHKFGNHYRYYHDAGIIYDDDPYILVVLTKDIGQLKTYIDEDVNEDERIIVDGGAEASEMIAEISRKIWDQVRK